VLTAAIGQAGLYRMGMLTLRRHDKAIHFDDAGFIATPYVYRPIASGQFYEEAFLEYVRSLGRVGEYVDAGAHLGTHTIWFATMCPATHVHAFEPVERYADVVRRNVAANLLDEKITVYQTGLAARRGRSTNYMSSEHQLGFVEGASTGVTEDFPVERLDDVIHGPVAVIKVDVEGMEAAVLLGAARILSQHRPLIFAEAHNYAALKEIARQIALFGYRPTGRVFNSSPTYEFSTQPLQGWQRLRPAYARLLSVLRA
jgi:FkbM family methyltransferase